MKIGVVGAGRIGGTLSKKWSRAGHEVHFGVRNPQKPEVRDLVKSLGAHTSVSSISDAIGWGEERSMVEKLISDVGLNPVFLGGPNSIDIVDNVLKMWFTLVSGRKMGRNIAFKLLTR